MRRLVAAAGLIALLASTWNHVLVFEDGSYAIGISSTTGDGWFLPQVWIKGCLPNAQCA